MEKSNNQIVTSEKAQDNISCSAVTTNSKQHLGFVDSFIDSFRRAPESNTSAENKRQTISKNELRLMAISTGLGTGLLVATGGRLRAAGPAGMVIAYAITGLVMLAPTVNSVAELAIAYPGLPGGFQSYYGKFIDESLGFALGWNYGFQWMCILALEFVTVSMTFKFWTTSVHADVFVAIFFIIVTLVNLGGAKVYAVTEAALNSIKIVFLVGFIIFGIIIDVGGGPNGFIGGKYYHSPGAFISFKGLASVFVSGAFSLGGSEFISLSASETKHPKTAIRAASKLVYFRVIVLFLGSLTLVGLLVPRDSDNLMHGSGSSVSPYVLAAKLNGVKVIPHIINTVILLSVTSVACAAMYSSPRLIQSLAEQGLGPKWLDYIDKKGRPTRAWFITILAGAFGFIAAFKDHETVFMWLLSISGISFVMCWLFICVCHLRFRSALKLNGIDVKTLEYVSPTGIWGSYISIIINSLILVAQFWISLWPLGGDGKPNALSFFENFLGGPVFLICYIGHKLWTKNWKLYKKVEDIDVNKDRVVKDTEILHLENLEDKERYEKAPLWKKILIICFD